jgi:hypothetical protein
MDIDKLIVQAHEKRFNGDDVGAEKLYLKRLNKEVGMPLMN